MVNSAVTEVCASFQSKDVLVEVEEQTQAIAR